MMAFSNFTVKLISFPVSTIDMTLAVAETLNPNKPNQNLFQVMLTTYPMIEIPCIMSMYVLSVCWDNCYAYIKSFP